MKDDKSIFTKAVHADIDLAKNHGALSVPIFNASVYGFEDADEGSAVHNYEKPGYYYGRLGNPTQTALEKSVASLENGEAALAFSSGMAAISAAILSNVRSGEHIVALQSMYSTTTSLFAFLSENFDISVTYVGATEAKNYADAIRPETKILWIETPSNPLLNISDISAIANISKEAGIISVVDNTFATPFNQRPLELGADLTVHSATKYFGGHSDLSAGLLVGNRERLADAGLKMTRLLGGSIAPQVAWLILRGIKTLALRMNQHNNNAYGIAHMLQSHPKIKAVYYPGLETQKNYDIAKQQMDGFGGMVSFDLGEFDTAKRFLNELDVCTIATSLGGVETIIQHSAAMTHAVLSKEERAKAGISEGLLRLSVGIEDEEDIKADLLNALDRIGPAV
ncbi:MAG: PLP-dependent transferase [Pyrinomonadaceae bacterium]|nr:PLP-dependent transferase [Pyrinomonadaceae bacterium]